MMSMAVLAFVWAPSLFGSIDVVNLFVPDYVTHPVVQERELCEEVAIDAVIGVVGQIKGISVIVVALCLLVCGIAHETVRSSTTVRAKRCGIGKCSLACK